MSTQTSSVALDLEKMDLTERVEHLGGESAIEGLSLPLTYGRPDIEAAVRQAILSVGKDQKVLIAACGPTGLISKVRNTTASCIKVDGPSVELHCEQFGW